MTELIKELESKEQKLAADLNEIRKQLCDARTKDAEITTGVKIGVIVKDNNGKRHKVVEIEPSSWRDTPWVIANPMKKDGTYGIARRNLYSHWNVVEEPQ